MKFWKNWPYWLRGGVVGAGITLIFIGLYYACPLLNPNDNWGCALSFHIPLIPFLPLIDNVEVVGTFFQSIPFRLLPIFYITIWFIIGSLIGGVVDYIKNKNS